MGEIHRPEPHILLFRRPLGTWGKTRRVSTVSHSTTGLDRVAITCTSLAGEDVAVLEMSRNDTFAHLFAAIADQSKFPKELLQLALADGTFVEEPNSTKLLGDLLP